MKISPKKPIFGLATTVLTLMVSSVFAQPSYAKSQSASDPQSEQVRAVETTKPVPGSWQRSKSAYAIVKARQQAVLSLPFSARITALEIEPGATVKKGQVLARFDTPQLKQHLAFWHQKTVEVSLAKKRLSVLRQSVKSHTVTRRDVSLGEIAVAQAQGQAGTAWEVLAADLFVLNEPINKQAIEHGISKRGIPALAAEMGRFRAPFSGIVVKRWSALGEQLAPNTPILELETLEQVYVEVHVTKSDLAFWKDGETRLSVNSGEENNVVLKALETVPLYDEQSGLWVIRFIADNPDLALRDGAWIEVVHKSAPRSVLWVPESAVVARNGKTWCIIQSADGQSKPAEVQVGNKSPDGRIPVLSGLEGTADVVSKGAYELLYRDIKDLIKFVD